MLDFLNDFRDSKIVVKIYDFMSAVNMRMSDKLQCYLTCKEGDSDKRSEQ